jgi:hypothetical protein
MRSKLAGKFASPMQTVAILLAVCILWPVAVSFAVDPDEYEPNNTPGQAHVLFLNDEYNQLHNFHVAGDQDWVKLYGLAGKPYQFGTENVAAQYDAVMELYSTDGRTVLTQECVMGYWPGDKCYFDWICPIDGVYYLKVAQKDPNVFGDGTDYELYAWDGAAPNFPGIVQGKLTDTSVPPAPVQAKIKCSGNIGETSSLSEADGNYYIYADAGDYTCTYESFGYRTMTDTITIQGGKTVVENYTMNPGVDLVVTKVAGPKTKLRNQPFQVTTTIKNQSRKAAGGFKVGLFLSRDVKIQNGKDLLIATFKVKNLAAGASSQVKTTVTLPTSVRPGTYYFGAMADVNKIVAELDEGNNAKCAKYKLTVQ